MTFQFLFYPFVQLNDLEKLTQPPFQHDDPVQRYQRGEANEDRGLATELFFWIPAKHHHNLVHGTAFGRKVSKL